MAIPGNYYVGADRGERRKSKEDLIRRYREDGLERLESDLEKKRENEKKNRNPVGSL